METTVAFSFQKHSPYRKLFSYFLLKMRQSGQIDKLYTMHENQVYTMKLEHETCARHKTSTFFKECRPNEPNCVPAIAKETVWSSSIILSFGVLFGAIVVLLEWLDYHEYINKFKTHRHNISNDDSFGKRGKLTICSVAFISITTFLVLLLLYYLSIGEVFYGQLNLLPSYNL